MGRAKGALSHGGTSLAERAARVLQAECRSVLVSVAPGGDNPAPGRAAIADAPPAGRGPLAGIDRAFEAVADADLLVLACDYPRVVASLVRRLLESAGPRDEVVLPFDRCGRDHPLVALWRRGVADRVRSALAAQRFAVRELIAEARVRRLGAADFPDLDLDAQLVNVNTPEELDRL